MTTVRDIETFLYAWAPRETAESWDNVGLLVGRGDREVRRVLAALDVTPAVAAEAAELGADLIVAHHPVMNVRWHEQEMQTLRDDTRLGGLLTCLVRHLYAHQSGRGGGRRQRSAGQGPGANGHDSPERAKNWPHRHTFLRKTP